MTFPLASVCLESGQGDGLLTTAELVSVKRFSAVLTHST